MQGSSILLQMSDHEALVKLQLKQKCMPKGVNGGHRLRTRGPVNSRPSSEGAFFRRCLLKKVSISRPPLVNLFSAHISGFTEVYIAFREEEIHTNCILLLASLHKKVIPLVKYNNVKNMTIDKT